MIEAECIVCMKGNDYQQGMCEKCYKEAIEHITKEPTTQNTGGKNGR